MMAVAKRGSAKIMTPAADWIRCAQVRDPTTRKKASWILRCSQMMPVRPQKTSRCPRWRRTGASVQDGSTLVGEFGVHVGHSAYFIELTMAPVWRGAASSRAARSLSRNWVAFAR